MRYFSIFCCTKIVLRSPRRCPESTALFHGPAILTGVVPTNYANTVVGVVWVVFLAHSHSILTAIMVSGGCSNSGRQDNQMNVQPHRLSVPINFRK